MCSIDISHFLHKKTGNHVFFNGFPVIFSVYERIRTSDPSLRRRVLYPAELRRRVIFSGFLGLPTICHFSSGGCYYVTLGGGRSILLSYRNVCGFFPYFQGFPAFRVRAPRAPNRPFFIRSFRCFLEISNIVVCSVMEHTTLLDFSFVILPPENRADKFFLPHDRYFLRRRVLYPAELRRHELRNIIYHEAAEM